MPDSIAVDGGRLLADLARLARVGATSSGGVSRPAYSDADLAARDLVRGWMRDAGLEARIDAAGNSFGCRDGRVSSLPPIVIGSHTDTVPDGGRFDGALGVLAAIETARTLHDRGIELAHALEVADFQNEEGGLIGSKIVAGRFDIAARALVAASGYALGDGIRRLGGNPDRLDDARRAPGSIAAYVELHIEQGRVLEETPADIGVVEGLVGICYWEVTFEGVASHAGTTPMLGRRDALLAAARFVDAVNRVVTSIPGRQVGTVGRLAVFPGGANVIPGKAVLTLELRDIDLAVVARLFERIEREGRAIANAAGTSVTFSPPQTNEPSLTDARVQRAVSHAAESLGLRPHAMPSGAGHDTQNMAKLGPAGMLFVPSVNGISHSPAEFTRDEDVVNGANVLLAAVIALDAELARG
jgi:beta-ureidopropionase / N-carbamoyl-L-amino-acid hydrolase